MELKATKILRRRCRRCRTTYLNEVPGVLRGGEFWPSRCPTCGRLEVAFIGPANWVEPGTAVLTPSPGGPEKAWKTG